MPIAASRFATAGDAADQHLLPFYGKGNQPIENWGNAAQVYAAYGGENEKIGRYVTRHTKKDEDRTFMNKRVCRPPGRRSPAADGSLTGAALAQDGPGATELPLDQA